ncbi:hypothetical protein WBG78_14840 [Chryseolinea sp. T2]|uniref:hypothetical protein n=1 Tax=Chryseolinea sp. T2 TaxID=3129255 RepID=UPI003077D278
MNQQPDKLFRDKLQHYQKAAPASAWDKIAVSKEEKKRHNTWLKVAASLLLIVGFWTTLELTLSDSSNEHLANEESAAPAAGTSQEAQKKSIQEEDSQASGMPSVAEQTAATPTENGATTGFAKKATTNAVDHGKETRRSHDLTKVAAATNNYNGVSTRITSDAPEVIADVQPLDEPGTRLNNNSVNDENEAVVARNEVVANGVKLTYNVDDVSAYLEKNINTDATDEEKKQSTLKKLLQKANDLKTNQDPFSELRQRKNEILALNFMNEKRGQKTRN